MIKHLNFKNIGIIKIVSFILVIVLIATTTYFYVKYKEERASNPSRELNELIKKIDKYMELPEEQPTLATVTEKEKLAEQNFFKQAENGDKVLIYINEGKAILYRPSSNRIIDVTNINQNEKSLSNTEDNKSLPIETLQIDTQKKQETDISQEVLEEQPLTITLLNGTDVVGLTKKVEDLLINDLQTYTIVDKEIANRNNYTQSLVVDVSGLNSQKANELAELISAKVVSFPEGESNVSSDLLVIVGSDLVN